MTKHVNGYSAAAVVGKFSSKCVLLSVALATSLACSAAGTEPQAALDAAGRVQGRLLVGARAGLSDASMASLAKGHGGKAKRIGNSNTHVLELPDNVSAAQVQALLKSNPQFKFVEFDGVAQPSFVANDPYLGSQWHLPKINVNTAWDNSFGQGVTVAVVDTGVFTGHPDLAANLVPGWNLYDNNADTTDIAGHGTQVSGVIAALSNNGLGVAGVAGATKIMPLKISYNSAGSAYFSTIASAITYAADHGVKLVNISYSSLPVSSSIISAAQYMRSKGGLVVICSGNGGKDEGYTPTNSMVIVGATDSNDGRAGWSSYGNFVTLTAPGVGIWTTNNQGGYSAPSGTSVASPVVAGVVALMMAANPSLTNVQLENILNTTAVDLGTAGRDIYFGHGRVDAGAAVSAAKALGAVDILPPTALISAPLANRSVSGLVPVDVAATDNTAVTRVELSANGTVVATDTAAPFQFSWDSSTVPNGTVNLVATAFDAAGNRAASVAVPVTVANGTPPSADTAAPVVSFASPAAGAVSGTVSVRTLAADNFGVAGVTQRLYIDGQSVATSTGANLSYSWNANAARRGPHTLTVVAQDAAGNRGTVTVRVTR